MFIVSFHSNAAKTAFIKAAGVQANEIAVEGPAFIQTAEKELVALARNSSFTFQIAECGFTFQA